MSMYGDTVNVGDTLINGWMEGKYTGIRYVHAKGEIEAKVWHTKYKSVSYKATERKQTGNSENKYAIKFNNFTINLYHDKTKQAEDFPELSWDSLDCEYGRILTAKGIYSCPFLANDHRGRCGSDFKDYAKHNTLETSFCTTCIRNKERLFGIDYKLFQ